ncbi:Hym1p [Entomophthora muscae]|uniref:Hym1p n=1 Tax=Entomophthora muscae TaxID=34485 RepID=A0ACC2SJW4_9FUNG|nr:Hym1p [Entomophthora muscae]
MEGLRSGRKQCKWQMFTFSGQFMFRTRSRTPIDSVRVLDNILQKWTAGIQPTPKVRPIKTLTYAKLVSEVVKHIFNIKAFLVSSEQEFTSEQISEFIKEVKDTDIIPLLILHMEKVDMESRKNVAKIFSSLMRYHSESPVSMVEYVATKPEILFALFHSYENKATALTCGMMLRECLRWEHLARTVLFSSNFYSFFEYVELVTFDLASDAFATFRVSKHKARLTCRKSLPATRN